MAGPPRLVRSASAAAPAPPLDVVLRPRLVAAPTAPAPPERDGAARVRLQLTSSSRHLAADHAARGRGKAGSEATAGNRTQSSSEVNAQRRAFGGPNAESIFELVGSWNNDCKGGSLVDVSCGKCGESPTGTSVHDD